MKLGILIFAISFGLAVLFATQWNEPSCVELGFGHDCDIGSDKPTAPWKVNQVLKVAAIKENSRVFDSWEEHETNRVKYTSAKLHSTHGVYTINIFPDSVTYWYRPHGQEWSLYTWADHDMDGEVDFGLVSDIMDKQARRFDGDFRIGLEFKPLYQKLYDRHLSAMIAELNKR